MNFKLFKHIASFLLLGMLLTSAGCKKKEIQGPKGEAGTNGTGGNASMSASAEFVVVSSEWVNTNNVWKYTFNSELITAKVIASGGVKVYMKLNGSWYELPYADGDILTQFGFSEGKVNLAIADIHGGLPDQPGAITFRLVTFYDSPRPASGTGAAISTTNQNAQQ